MGLKMPTPQRISFVQRRGAGKARPASRFDLVFLFGPCFVPLAAFLIWGCFAWAVGLHWRAVLAVGVLACATALGYAVVIAGAAGLGGKTEVRRRAPALRRRERGLSRAVETRWNSEG
jgi:cation transport ATPase